MAQLDIITALWPHCEQQISLRLEEYKTRIKRSNHDFLFCHVKKKVYFCTRKRKVSMKKITTLEQSLGFLSSHKEDLLDNARIMGLNADNEWDNLTPLQIKKCMAKAILDNPLSLLKQLPIEDLMILRALADTEPGKGMVVRITQQMIPMAVLGLADQATSKEDKTLEIVSITEDFKEAIRPYIDGILDYHDVKLRLKVEEYLIGALNIYGILTRSELKTILKKCLHLEDDGSGLFDRIYPYSIALKNQDIEAYYPANENFFISPFVSFYGDIIKERDKRKDITSLKDFSPDAIKKAGQMPLPEFPNPVNNKLIKVLQGKLGYSEQEAYYMRYVMWQMAQTEDASVIIESVLENTPVGENGKALNDALPVLSDYLNNTPQWIFRGRCPADLYVPPSSAPAISLGPNMRAMGYRQEEMQQMVNGMWNSVKVGRNDPCPCGSGKKYKHCCGRNY